MNTIPPVIGVGKVSNPPKAKIPSLVTLSLLVLPSEPAISTDTTLSLVWDIEPEMCRLELNEFTLIKGSAATKLAEENRISPSVPGAEAVTLVSPLPLPKKDPENDPVRDTGEVSCLPLNCAIQGVWQ